METTHMDLARQLEHLQDQYSQLQKQLQDQHTLYENLRSRHSRYQDLIELAADAILTGDSSGQLIDINQSAIDLTGYSRSELLAMNITALFSPKEQQRSPLRYDLLKQGKVIQTERLLSRKDSTTVPIEMNSKMMPDGTYHTFIRDISRRKGFEQALLDSEAHQRALADAAFEAIFLSSNGRCLSQNKNAEQMFGYTLEEAIGRPGTDWIAPEEHERVLSKARSGYSGTYETIAVRKDGSRFPAEIRGRSIICQGESLRVTALRDISSEKQAEQDQYTLQKLESIGTLAGGIAHDFNNILTGFFGSIALAKMQLDRNHKAYSFLSQAEKSLHRATHLTNKLLTFAKGGEPVREHVRLDELVRETVSFDLSGSNVKLVLENAPNLWYANVDKGQMQQVFSNLTLNANQAMPDGGHLYIELSNYEASDLNGPVPASRKFLRAVVRDEGVGIDPRHLSRVFDPYFSTKQTGRGLGLASVYSIITKHGGQISVTSKAGQGTVFTLYLPATERLPDDNLPVGAENVYNGTGYHILIMDDDEAIRSILRELLEKINCTVVTAEDGQAATSKYRSALLSGGRFDLAIVDVTVPGGSGGKETVSRLLQLDPQARVIVSSGYTDDPLIANYREYGFKNILAKPFSPRQLYSVISSVLDA